MEERISVAESRGAAPGYLFHGLLNALQRRNTKGSHSCKSANDPSSSKSYSSLVSVREESVDEKNDAYLDDIETWNESLTSTKKKINQTWEHYSPTFKVRVQKYSPGPLRRLRNLFTVSEERDSNYDAEEMESEKAADDIDGNNVCVIHSDDQADSIANNCSSQVENVPTNTLDSVNALPLPDSEKTNESRGMDHPPHIILEEADSNEGVKDLGVHGNDCHHRKSPLTVQEWVDHLPTKNNIYEKDCENSSGSKDLDNLCVTDTFPTEEKFSLTQRLSRDASVQSSSSLDSILDSRRPDPVEVLLNLGFGGVPGVDMNNCRIPKRFLVPSECKGGDWNEFLKRELLQAQNFECASLGFRGLSGPSYRRPSAIVANIMEKLREQTTPRPQVKNKFSSVARRVLNEKIVLSKLVSQSVLSPDNRKFLESQGKISPEVPRRKIIFGQKSFAFGNDGEFIEVESSSSRTKVSEKECEASVDGSSVDSDLEDGKMNQENVPSPNMMLKLRRSSLQRQKKIEIDPESVDPDLNDEKDLANETSGGKDSNHANDKSAKDKKKIPMRFKSSTNLNAQIDKTSEEIKTELEEEIKTLSEKIQSTNTAELSSILLQIKELRTRLESSSEIGTENQ